MRRSVSFILSVATIAIIAVIYSCGSGGGGGSERFSTVEIFASYESNVYTADAEIAEDTDGDGTCDLFSVTADDVVATVTSTAYDPLPNGVDPCDVNILRYSIVFYPQTGDSPEIPSKIIYQQIAIPAPGSAGSSLVTDVTLRLFDINDKRYLLPLYAVSPAAEFQYSAKVRLTMEEVCTRIQEHVEFWIPIRYFNAATDTCT